MQHKKYYGKYEFRDSLIRETVTNQNNKQAFFGEKVHH